MASSVAAGEFTAFIASVMPLRFALLQDVSTSWNLAAASIPASLVVAIGCGNVPNASEIESDKVLLSPPRLWSEKRDTQSRNGVLRQIAKLSGRASSTRITLLV